MVAGKIHQLTGLRFFAAVLVFLSHVLWVGANPHAMRIFEAGYVGVSFFFVLSGFVLSFSYREKIVSGALGFRRYAMLRLARLMPLHLVTALPFLAQLVHNGKLNLPIAVLNLLLLQSWIPHSDYYFSLNSPAWSLSNEIFFYFCFFFLVAFSSAQLLRFLAVGIVTIACLALGLDWYAPELVLFGDESVQHWLFYIFPLFRLVEFVTGMLLFDAWKNGYRLPTIAILPAYLLLAGCMYVARDIPEAFRMSLFFLPAISLFLYCHLSEGSVIGSFLSSRPLVLLGNASFAFYLIHRPIIVLAQRRLHRLDLPPLLIPVLLLVAVTVASLIVYLVFEKRVERTLKGWINAKSAILH